MHRFTGRYFIRTVPVSSHHSIRMATSHAADERKSLEEGFREAAEAAEQGAQATVNMTAKKGRARFLGEKSVGKKDAGAASMATMVGAMYMYLKQ